MKILVVGATGTLGKAVVAALEGRHEIVKASIKNSAFQVDITSDESVTALYKNVGPIDAVISTTGGLFFGHISNMRPQDFNVGLQNKLLGQIRLALLGQHVLRDGGSITLTSGILSDEPIHQGANACAVNSAIDGFVRGAAVEMPRQIRINAVSPTMLTESAADYGSFFPGFESVPAARAANAFVRSVEGPQTGRVYRVWE